MPESVTPSTAELRKTILAELSPSRFRSWSWREPEFAAPFETITKDFSTLERYEIMWKTDSKFVVRMPFGDAGQQAAVKLYRRSKWIRDLVVPTDTVQEAVNLKLMRALNFPMVRLLAAADFRRQGRITESLLATVFAADYECGVYFLPGQRRAGDRELRLEFVRANCALLAKMHALNGVHHAFLPYNLLWKRNAAGVLEVCWLDVATCRFGTPGKVLPNALADRDLEKFFRKMVSSREERRAALQAYRAVRPDYRGRLAE